jgi:sensor c-di-GMP phosphodiesterase-like protein
MGRILRALTRRNLIAIVAGVLLASVPLVAFDFWLGAVLNRQGNAEVALATRRALSLADTRLNQAGVTLDGLVGQGVDSCEPRDLETMRRAAFEAAAVKAVAVLGPDGQTICTTLDLPFRDKLVSTETWSNSGGTGFDIVRLPDGRAMIRLRRKATSGDNEIAVFVPAVLLLPQVTIKGSPLSAFVRLTTRGGALIGVIGQRPQQADTAFAVKLASDQYDIVAQILVPRGMVPAEREDLQLIGLLCIAAVILILGIFAVVIRRRTPGNPVAEIARALEAGEFVP